MTKASKTETLRRIVGVLTQKQLTDLGFLPPGPPYGPEAIEETQREIVDAILAPGALVHTPGARECEICGLLMEPGRQMFRYHETCQLPPKPSTEPYEAGTCDWGDCDASSVAWRWNKEHRDWLPVCKDHKERDR